MQSNLLDIEEAARYLGGVAVPTLRTWTRKRLVPFVRLPGGRLIRFRVEDLDAVVLAGRTEPRQGKEGEA